MAREWHCVTVAEAAVFALGGLGLSSADGWAVVPTAVMGVLACCVLLLVPGLVASEVVLSRAATGAALAVLAVLAACVGMDLQRDDHLVSLWLWAPRWEATGWQAVARARALLVVLPAAAICAACVRAAGLEAEAAADAGAEAAADAGAANAQPAKAPAYPRLSGWVGVVQLLVAQVQLTLAENEGRERGNEHHVLNSFEAIRDWMLLILLFLWVLETVAMAVFLFVDGLPGQIAGTVAKTLSLVFWIAAAAASLWPAEYVWWNGGLVLVQAAAAARDVCLLWLPDAAGKPKANTQKIAAPAALFVKPKLQNYFAHDVAPLSRQSWARGIPQATRFAPTLARATRIRKVKEM